MSCLLQVRGLVKIFGALVATNDLHLQVMPGEVHALIGPNGAGKSTLVAQLAGELAPDSGSILFEGLDITNLPVPERVARGIVRSFQITSIFPQFSALTNVSLAVQARAGHSFKFWRDASTDPTLREPAQALLDQVGLGVRGNVPAGELAYGEQRQLEIAMALATKPHLLLLDEPLAGMGREEARVIVDLLRRLRGGPTILLIEHDMDVVFSIADRITVLVYGTAIATDRPDAIRANAEVQQAYLGGEMDHA
ncbi:branched-chain amino acid ABC transporter,ATP-binding component [Paramagnetospirillum caucaseum]|uniref:Branched-chain amino acid ABC transporter,ATP-binding component n=1 Tax=Paramagnetospirillum caucaseum TaxID=1244869 RepID=M3A9V8_9PROT|nr:ABC transporter ATP-binding protein [Paramagnetospirillum caucaseum]EME69294.1 branched-chain amino acid ABC transporter,ATP-binding component [Paramagnetospirillum caucaseum]